MQSCRKSKSPRGIFTVSLIGLVVFFGQPGSAEPPDALASLLEQFQAVHTLSASFIEEKRISLLSEPLINFGHIEYSRPMRLERRTTKPFESIWRLERNLMMFDDGREKTTIDLREYPEASRLATAFMDVLEGDVDRLRKNFRANFVPQRGDAPWKLELTPLIEGNRSLFRRIEISGRGVLVQRLVVIERSGDTSTTTFSGVRIQTAGDDVPTEEDPSIP
jgi:outer membrane lipoprotein-sorting protein